MPVKVSLLCSLLALSLWGEVGFGQSLDSQSSSHPGQLSPVLIKAPQSPLSHYLAYVQTPASSSDHWISLADYQEQELRQRALKQEPALVLAFEQGQRAYLRGDLQQAKPVFTDLGERALTAHWSEESRWALHFALLRRAQLSESPKTRRLWLLQALQLDWELQPKGDLFSPDLLQEYKELSEGLQWISLRPWQVWPWAHRLLINGKSHPISPGQALSLPQVNELRIALLSHSHTAQDFQISWSELEREGQMGSASKIAPTTLAGGHCLQPEWLGPDLDPAEREVGIYYDSNCVVNKKSSSLGASVKALAHTEANNFPKPPKVFSEAHLGPRLNSPWLWLGAAVITTAVLFHEQERGGGKSPKGGEISPLPHSPSHSFGW